jgi:Putative restriction endonuclease
VNKPSTPQPLVLRALHQADTLTAEVFMAPLQKLDQKGRRSRRGASAVPPLENGDRLMRDEFERRYEASPEGVKAELIDGVVYMASPTKLSHGRGHGLVTTWLGTYASRTPGSEMLPETTTRLGSRDEPELDAVLRVLPGAGGLSRDEEDDYLAGPLAWARHSTRLGVFRQRARARAGRQDPA